MSFYRVMKPAWLKHMQRYGGGGGTLGGIGTDLSGGMKGLFGTGDSGAGSDASGQNAAAAQQGIQAIRDMLGGYAKSGEGFMSQAGGMLSKGFDPSQFLNDPSYDFTRSQGLRATQQAAGTQGSPLGGDTLTALDQYSTGLANQYYNQAFSRWQGQIGQLTNLAQLGAGAAGSAAGGIGGIYGGLMSTNAQNAATTQSGSNSFMGML